MYAKDVMTRPVISVNPACTVAQVVEVMLKHGLSGLPVIDDAGRLAGIVTEQDLLRRGELGTEVKRPRWVKFLLDPESLASEYVRAHGRSVREVMTAVVAFVGEDTQLDEVVRRMEHYRVKRVPVLSEGKVVGIVSRGDIVRALASRLAESTPRAADDDAIHGAIVAEMQAQPWAASRRTRVIVHDGVVRLEGSVATEQQRQAIHVIAENVGGVKSIDDRLVCNPLGGYVF